MSAAHRSASARVLVGKAFRCGKSEKSTTPRVRSSVADGQLDEVRPDRRSSPCFRHSLPPDRVGQRRQQAGQPELPQPVGQAGRVTAVDSGGWFPGARPTGIAPPVAMSHSLHTSCVPCCARTCVGTNRTRCPFAEVDAVAHKVLAVASEELVELHLHLDISMSFHVASQLVPGLNRADYEAEFQGPHRCPDLADSLSTTGRQVALLQDSSALRLLTDDVVRRAAAEGVIYAELRFAPLLHTGSGMAPETVVETVLEAAADASAQVGIDPTIILCSLRQFSGADSLRTADLAIRYAAHGVAIDLGGDEGGFPLASHLPAFRRVMDAGVPHTVHAGEGAGPESVREVLDLLSPKRLGHGVRAIEDPDLVARIVDQQVHLEICPSCKCSTRVVPDSGPSPNRSAVQSGRVPQRLY
jgi:adenosine deaminase